MNLDHTQPPHPATPPTHADPALAKPPRLLRIEAEAAADDRGATASPPPRHGPVALLFDAREADRLSPGRLLAVGSAEELDRHEAWVGTPPEARRTVRRAGCVLLPAMVNAHAHLDLTPLGPRPPSDPTDPSAFAQWLDMVRRERPATPEAIEQGVRLGVRASLQGGVAAVGDVAGAPGGQPRLEAAHALQKSPLLGISEVEFFGIGASEDRGRDWAIGLIEREGAWLGSGASSGVRLGLQAHAPYSVAEPTFRALAARARGVHLSTHLAESLAERRFIAEGTGPQRALLESLGLWNERVAGQVGHGRHPIEHLERALVEAAEAGSPFLCAHVHDCPRDWGGRRDDYLLGVLARAGVSVAYCPRSSEAFGSASTLGAHRYRAFLEAGINVCLGTDSLVSCPAGTRTLSPLDEARLLYRRDGGDPRTLVAMCTTRGARALGIEKARCRFIPGQRPLGVVAVAVDGQATDPLGAVLASSSPAEHVGCILPEVLL